MACNLWSAAISWPSLSAPAPTSAPCLPPNRPQIEQMKAMGEFGKPFNRRKDQFSMYVEARARAHMPPGGSRGGGGSGGKAGGGGGAK
jgi:hypothetical protein